MSPTELGGPAPRGSIIPDESIRCMQRLAQGDERALAELHGRWARPLMAFLAGMCGDRSLAEDLTQEVFVRVWRAAPRYEPTAKFSTWLFHIARNHWLNEREKRMHRVRAFSLDQAGHDEDQPSLDVKDQDARTPDAEALDRELGKHIQRAVARLPEKLRETWVLAVSQGLPYQEVGEILSIPVGTVKSRMFQAMRAVRDDLKPYLGEDCPDDLR